MKYIFNNTPFVIIILIYLLLLSLIQQPLLNMKTTINIDKKEQKPNIDLESIINDIIKRKRLNISDPRIKYSLCYGGRIVRFKASLLRDIHGISPREIVFAYFDGKQWNLLPTRIYNRVVKSNLTTIYVLPHTINDNTVIELKLPSKYPLYTDPHINIPEFARTAECRLAKLIEKRSNNVLGYIYLFMGKVIVNSIENHILFSTYDYSNINEYFEAVENPPILRYMREIGYSDKIIKAVRNKLLSKTIDIGRDPELGIEITWVPPIPDSGYGGQPYLIPNLLELRPQPLYSMVEYDYNFTSTELSHVFNIYVVDPSISSNSLKWKSITLTIIIGREPSDDVERTLEIRMWSPDNSYSYSRTYSIVGDEINIIQFTYLPSAYGVSYKNMYVELSIDKVNNSARWGFRLHPLVYIWWDTEDLEDLAKPVSLYPIVDSVFNTYFGPDTAERVSGIFIQPFQLLSVPNPTQFIDFTIKAQIISTTYSSNAPNYIYPVTISIDFGGIATCTLSLPDKQVTSSCTFSIFRQDIVVLSEKYEAIPVTITFEINQPLPEHEYVLLETRIWMDNPGMFPTRPMYTYNINAIINGEEDRYLLTSTRPSGAGVWSQNLYYTGGITNVVMAYQGPPYSGYIYKDVYMKGYIIRLSRQGEQDIGYVNYHLIIDTSSPEEVQYCFQSGSGETMECPVIHNAILDNVEIKIYFPDTVDLSTTTYNTLKFILTGKLPQLPELSPIISIPLSKIPYLGIAMKTYSTFSWTWNKAAVETGSGLEISIDKNNKVVTIKWYNGLFSSNEFKGIVKIIDVYVAKRGEPITIVVDMNTERIGTIYSWRART